MATLTKSQLDINSAKWVDVNPTFGDTSLPLRLPNSQSVLYCSLYALLNCPVGDRGGIGEPEYGSTLHWFLQEPVSPIVAEQIKTSLLATIRKWEPRLRISQDKTTVTPLDFDQGYAVHLEGTYIETGTTESADLTLQK